MDQPDFAPLHEAACRELLLDQQALTSERDGLTGATKSNCPDCDPSKMAQPDFSPLFVQVSSSLVPDTATKAPFANLVERSKFLW